MRFEAPWSYVDWKRVYIKTRLGPEVDDADQRGRDGMSDAMDTDSPPKIRISTSDGQVFEVPEDVAKVSETLKHMVEEAEGGGPPHPLPLVSSAQWILIRKWIDIRLDSNPNRLEGTALKAWDDEFWNVSHAVIFDLILASNYLNINRLFRQGTAVVAEQIRDKTPDEILAFYNMRNTLTSAEEKTLAEENPFKKPFEAPSAEAGTSAAHATQAAA